MNSVYIQFFHYGCKKVYYKVTRSYYEVLLQLQGLTSYVLRLTSYVLLLTTKLAHEVASALSRGAHDRATSR